MFRNKEKAGSALNRFQQEQRRQAGVLESNPNLRPKFVQKEQSLPQAEKWRLVVMSEISTKLTRIQDPLLEDYDIRELNESINKLFREQRAWEYHIKSLGGPDHIKFSKDLQSTGMIDPGVSGIKGFRYFGRAKDLPELREFRQLQQTEKEEKLHDSGKEIRENSLLEDKFNKLNPFYFEPLAPQDIYNDIIKQVSSKVDDKSVLDALDETYDHEEKYDFDTVDSNLLRSIRQQANQDGITRSELTAKAKDIIDYETLPTTEDVKAYIIEKKKQELLNKYSS